MNRPVQDQQQAEQLVESMQKQIEAMEGNQNKQNVFYWNLQQLADSTDGDIWLNRDNIVEAEQCCFNQVSTDSRTIQTGALYIAIKGPNFDGHQFIEAAIKQGAVAVLASEEPHDSSPAVPVVVVEDTRIALGQFARWHRLQMPLKKLIAITGSNGKTTVKTLLAQILANQGKTLATQGNLNNDFGVPRTLLDLRPEHEYAVIEMGANHLHEIAYLTDLALPDIALLNNASAAHLEGFGSLQGVIDTKGEIFQGLNHNGRSDGVAIINTDSPGYQDWLEKVAHLKVKHVCQFGRAEHADIRVLEVNTRSEDLTLEINLRVNGQAKQCHLATLGEHNALNAAACIAAALNAGLQWSVISLGISQFRGVGGRLQQNKITSGWLLDDSYNANPASVKAGIDALLSLDGEAVVCLGAMAEIGEQSEHAHAEVALYAQQKEVGQLLVIGEKAKQMPMVFGENAHYFDSHQALADAVCQIIEQAAQQSKPLNILVKGSRSAKMERIASAINDKFSC